MTEIECGVYGTDVVPKVGEEFGFYLYPIAGHTDPTEIADIGCGQASATDKRCPATESPAALSGASCVKMTRLKHVTFFNRVYRRETEFVWGSCAATCSARNAACPASSLGVSEQVTRDRDALRVASTEQSPLGLGFVENDERALTSNHPRLALAVNHYVIVAVTGGTLAAALLARRTRKLHLLVDGEAKRSYGSTV